MLTPFFRLPVTVNDPTAPMITGAKPIFPPALESEVLAHWQFGKHAASLTDLVNGVPLTRAGAAPVYAENYLTIPDGGMNGLISTLDDRVAYTFGFVVRAVVEPFVTTKQRVFFGSSTANAPDGGSMVWQTLLSVGESALQYQSRPDGNWSLDANERRLLTGLENDQWYVLFAGRDTAGRFMASPGAKLRNPVLTADYTADSTALTPALSTRKLALGNAYYITPSYQNGLAFSETIVWPKKLNAAECVSAARRMAARAAYRGITVAAVE